MLTYSILRESASFTMMSTPQSIWYPYGFMICIPDDPSDVISSAMKDNITTGQHDLHHDTNCIHDRVIGNLTFVGSCDTSPWIHDNWYVDRLLNFNYFSTVKSYKRCNTSGADKCAQAILPKQNVSYSTPHLFSGSNHVANTEFWYYTELEWLDDTSYVIREMSQTRPLDSSTLCTCRTCIMYCRIVDIASETSYKTSYHIEETYKNGYTYWRTTDKNKPKSFPWPTLPSTLNTRTRSAYRHSVVGTPPFLLQDLLRSRDNLLQYIVSNYPGPAPEVWGDLAQVACDDARATDINTVAFGKEILEIRDTVLGLYDLFQGELSLRALSSLYLSARYGLSLTLRDANALGKAVYNSISKDTLSCCRAASSATIRVPKVYSLIYQDSYHYKIYYDSKSNELASALKTLMDWDVFPTLQNVWDFIPYSFVVDWVTGIEPLLNRIDTRTYISTLPVSSVLRTRKTICNVPQLLVYQYFPEFSGDITVISYRRTIRGTVDLPLWRIDVPTGFRNFPELTALILQRMS